MVRNTCDVNFYCRESKKNRKGLSHIELSLSVNGNRHFYNTPMLVKPEEFNRKRQPKEIKDYCDLMRSRVNSIITDMLSAGEPITSTKILSYLRTGGYRSKTIEVVFSEWTEIAGHKIGNNFSAMTHKKYITAANEFYKVVDKDKEFQAITNADIQRFQAHLSSKYKPSSAASIMTKIKTLYTFGVQQGYGKNGYNAFNGIKITKPKSDIEYLTEDEIKKIVGKHYDIERMEKVRDLAVFQISSGLSYCDCMNLQPEDIHYADGIAYVQKDRKKTGVEYTAPIFPEGMEILEKYQGVLPHFSNQRLNSYYKELADTTGITQNLHCHLFRKTYATRLINRGVRLEVVSKCLGHANTAVTQSVYAKVLKNTIINEIKAVL